jgi:hypothetical protein
LEIARTGVAALARGVRPAMQDSPSIQAGDARLRAFDTNRAALAVLV